LVAFAKLLLSKFWAAAILIAAAFCPFN